MTAKKSGPVREGFELDSKALQTYRNGTAASKQAKKIAAMAEPMVQMAMDIAKKS